VPKKKFISYSKAKRIVLSVKLSHRNTYQGLVRSGALKDMPIKPEEAYKGQWEDWGEFLGIPGNPIIRALMSQAGYLPANTGDRELWQKVKKALKLIPQDEAEMIDMYFFQPVKQAAMAEYFGISQPSIHYRLFRALERLEYAIQVPKLSLKDKEKLGGFFKDPIDGWILALLYETTCQTEVARQLNAIHGLNVSQGFVRHRIRRAIEELRQDEEMEHYADAFQFVSENKNQLRYVTRLAPSSQVRPGIKSRRVGRRNDRHVRV